MSRDLRTARQVIAEALEAVLPNREGDPLAAAVLRGLRQTNLTPLPIEATAPMIDAALDAIDALTPTNLDRATLADLYRVMTDVGTRKAP